MNLSSRVMVEINEIKAQELLKQQEIRWRYERIYKTKKIIKWLIKTKLKKSCIGKKLWLN